MEDVRNLYPQDYNTYIRLLLDEDFNNRQFQTSDLTDDEIKTLLLDSTQNGYKTTKELIEEVDNNRSSLYQNSNIGLINYRTYRKKVEASLTPQVIDAVRDFPFGENAPPIILPQHPIVFSQAVYADQSIDKREANNNFYQDFIFSLEHSAKLVMNPKRRVDGTIFGRTYKDIEQLTKAQITRTSNSGAVVIHLGNENSNKPGTYKPDAVYDLSALIEIAEKDTYDIREVVRRIRSIQSKNYQVKIAISPLIRTAQQGAYLASTPRQNRPNSIVAATKNTSITSQRHNQVTATFISDNSHAYVDAAKASKISLPRLEIALNF